MAQHAQVANPSFGATHAPSPDVRCGHPALRSLGCRRRFAILASLVGIRRLPGHGQPLAEFMPHSNADGVERCGKPISGRAESTSRDDHSLLRETLAEFLGTFVLLMLGLGMVAQVAAAFAAFDGGTRQVLGPQGTAGIFAISDRRNAPPTAGGGCRSSAWSWAASWARGFQLTRPDLQRTPAAARRSHAQPTGRFVQRVARSVPVGIQTHKSPRRRA